MWEKVVWGAEEVDLDGAGAGGCWLEGMDIWTLRYKRSYYLACSISIALDLCYMSATTRTVLAVQSVYRQIASLNANTGLP